jgi:hypothetical protein
MQHCQTGSIIGLTYSSFIARTSTPNICMPCIQMKECTFPENPVYTIYAIDNKTRKGLEEVV